MANVLGELFADIATAIRSKTGDEETMKPLDFPEKINGISARDLSLLPIVVKDGSFKPDSSIYTFNHDLGVVPDVLIVYDTEILEPKQGVYLRVGIGYGDKMTELLKRATDYPGRVTYALLGENLTGAVLKVGDDSSISTCTDRQVEWGNLRSATESTCTIGGNNVSMNTEMNYNYIAIGGLF